MSKWDKKIILNLALTQACVVLNLPKITNFFKVITDFGEDVEKLEPSCIASGNVKWGRCLGKQFESF